jgi:uncharacterized protein (TIGR00251 family)
MPLASRLAVKAIPGASRDAVEGWMGDELKVRIRAPALDGRANDALCEFLAASLGVPRRTVSLLRGEKSRHKVIAIEQLTAEEIRRRLSPPSPSR